MVRKAIFACLMAVALSAAPALAGTLSGKVVAVDGDTITVVKDGMTKVYVLPPDLEIRTQTPTAQPIEISRLRGQTVVLTVDESSPQASRQGKPLVSEIRVQGDLEIDSDTEIETDE